MLDLIIAGGGPAGAAAAVYAARKQLKTVLITEDWGGQSVVSEDIQNWVGTVHISGADLAKQLRAHVEEYAKPCVDVRSPSRTRAVSIKENAVSVTLDNDSELTARALLIATGARRRALTIPGADTFEQKGLTYCASCDGPLFSGMEVAVIGGGNAGFETAAQLLAYAKSVTLLNRSEKFKADEVTVSQVLSHPNMTALTNAEPVGISGDTFVNGIRWRNIKTDEEHTLPVLGIFVEIGLIPNTDWTKDAVKRNEHSQIIVDPRTQRTSHPRIWSAGDCTDGRYHQNNIAAGDAVKAIEDIYMFLSTKESALRAAAVPHPTE